MRDRMSFGRWVRKVGAAGALGLGAACVACVVWAADPIKIGLVLESTGAYAEYGRESTRGATLALEEINAAGGVLGRPLQIVSEDNQSTNPGSVVAVSTLLATPDVKAIVTTLHSSQVQAMMPAIAGAGIPAMVGGTSYALTHANNPWIFRARPHDGYSARVIADFGVHTLNKKKWAIVHAAESFGIDGKDSLTQELKAQGITPVIALGVNTYTQNFNPVVLALKKADIDIVATYLSAIAAGNFAKQMRLGGVDAQLIGSTSLSSPPARRIAQDALDNSFSARDYVENASPAAQAFARKYKQRWSAETDERASWVYDAVHLLARAMNDAGDARPDAIRKALLAIRNQPATQGTFNFDPNGDGLHGYTIVRNDRDKIVVIKAVVYAPR